MTETPTLPPLQNSFDTDEIDAINAHSVNSPTIECGQCGQKFKNANGLKIHISRKHGSRTIASPKRRSPAKRASRAVAVTVVEPPPAPVPAVTSNGHLEALVSAVAVELVDRALADARVRLLAALGVPT